MKRNMIFVMVAIFALSVFAFAGTEGQKKVDIKVDGMTCANCVGKVKGALEKVDGVKDAKVSLDKNNAVIVYDSKKTDEKALHKIINATGFKAKVDGDKKACPADCAGDCCAVKDANKET
jgi:copper chaperone CopZ